MLPLLEAVRIQIPDDAGTTYISTAEFEPMLSASDPLAACRLAGDQWISAAANLVLAAPSVVIPGEFNIMLNPAHPRMSDVVIMSARAFSLRSAARRPPQIVPRAAKPKGMHVKRIVARSWMT